MSESLFRIGMGNSCDVDIDEVYKRKNLLFAAYLEKDKEIYSEDFATVNEARNFYQGLTAKGKEIQKIDESTQKELSRIAEIKRKGRAKHIKVFYQGVANARGWITFKTTSQFTLGKYYTQYIHLAEDKDIKSFKGEFTPREIVNLFMSGDIQVYCSCPDFRYRYKYMSFNMGYGIFKELRYPKIRNPRLDGSVCKHLIAVLTVFQDNWKLVSRDMTKTKYWKARMSGKSVRKIRAKGLQTKRKNRDVQNMKSLSSQK